MDIDAFLAVHGNKWSRLHVLAHKRRLTGAEADELLRLYQTASSHLSLIRSVAPESALSASLSASLAQARTRFTGARSNFMEDLARFFVIALPAAFYRIRWLTIWCGVAFVVVAGAYALWIGTSADALRAVATDAKVQQYVDEDFIDYYSENPAASFAGAVWTNNAWISAQAVAFGVTGFWVPFILFMNAQSTGVAAGLFLATGKMDVFFSYILPHGLMELTAVFIACAAGLKIFWAMVRPGPRTRMQAVADEGRSLITVALGLVLVLLVSGIVEGFVTPSPLPVWAKITIGALVLAAYWSYTLVLGGRAARAGVTGDLDPHDAGYRSIAA
ncbi:stage II sporulation protein M [Paenarthrobacter ilicis]|uniref:Membrane protein SpoIIM required for sporulation n=1 Tax=Paenarthrobacter ilicis TaxID=43665 RepID=A0ABX0TG68_9MICC|nr:stage II sporulation protein M [Paenarthrobacter ilicis]MBM7792561.1 putative membrane protein SpoIIM required for sporulation [Paenarthrobacter ilicis]NIJ00905.1 putative membrane protein SpoIIM required for sporulation [Paenarthrobacter ilicis]